MNHRNSNMGASEITPFIFCPALKPASHSGFMLPEIKNNSGRWSEDLVILHNRVKIQTADEREL